MTISELGMADPSAPLLAIAEIARSATDDAVSKPNPKRTPTGYIYRCVRSIFRDIVKEINLPRSVDESHYWT